MLLFRRPPKPLRFDDHVKPAREHVANAVRDGRKLKTKEDFAPLWGDFKSHFAEAQRGKCGFCERDITTHWGDVEHFRPKNGIEELPEDPGERGEEDAYSGRMVKPRKLRAVFDAGYSWLAYEWDNYLLSCARCNRTWKRCLFPIVEPRSCAPGEHGVETPLLLSPFGPHDPVRHLAYTTVGSIEPRDGSPMGRATIDTCGLDQPPLVRSRAAVAARVVAVLEDIENAGTMDQKRRSLRALLDLGADGNIHAGMVRSIVEEEAGVSWADLSPGS